MRAYIGFLLFLSFSPNSSALGIWNEWAGVKDRKAHKVMQYLNLDQDSRLVILAAGKDEEVNSGSILKTYRRSQPSKLVGAGEEDGAVWVRTGELKVVDVQDKFTIAEVITSATPMSKAFFPKFPGVMAGDLAVSQKLALVRKQVVTPTVTASYFDLFVDPKASPGTFELKPSGLGVLRQAVAPFMGSRLSLLMVEGYTDQKGEMGANQVESYQRALTVRQFLIDELGFDESRVVAVGYGESEQIDAAKAPGYMRANRRIVFKAIPMR